MVIDGIEYLDNVNWQFVREHQEEQLKTAKAVAKICEENGLRYFLDCGTLLGAFRHEGFIPWDDDIDFAMPRPDYEKLVSILRNTPGMKVINWRVDANCCFPFSKVMRWMPGQEVSHHPSAMDIFPIDAAPKTRWMNKFQTKIFIAFVNVFIYRMNRRASTHPIISCILNAILPKKKSRVIDIFDRVCRHKSEWKPESWIGVRYQPSGYKYFVPFKIYDNGTVRKQKFCDTEFRVPVESEKFLTQFFGDWKQLPPIEQRIPKHEHEVGDYWFYSEIPDASSRS